MPISKDGLRPEIQQLVSNKIKQKQQTQKQTYDKHAGRPHKIIKTGEPIRYINHHSKWVKGTITEIDTNQSHSYTIKNENGNTIVRHRKQIITSTPHTKQHNIETYKPQNTAQVQKTSRYSRILKPCVRLDL